MMQRLIIQWLAGTVVGTTLIAVTSPLFVRSYVSRDIDPLRAVRTLPAGVSYRWRSEGYASTKIGPHGMPGRTRVGEAKPGVTRIALWGDSQAEGVCVSDDQKLFAQIERLSEGSLDVLPLAQSGDGATQWVKQIPVVEQKLAIDRHVILIVDLGDLLISDTSPAESGLENRLASLPAFLIQSSRNLITDSTKGEIRQLRFSVGPRNEPKTPSAESGEADWLASIRRLRESTDHPITILYAPLSPSISFGKAKFENEAVDRFLNIELIANSLDIQVINVHEALCRSARAGSWPHGFHNGKIGSGHLNAVGNAVIAEALVDVMGDR